MDKWDKKENGIDSLIPLISKYLESESKKPILHNLRLSLTSEQLAKVSEALKE